MNKRKRFIKVIKKIFSFLKRVLVFVKKNPVVLGIAFLSITLVVSGWMWFRAVRTESWVRGIGKMDEQPSDGVLRDISNKEERGTVQKASDERGVHRVNYQFKAGPPPDGQQYVGWLADADKTIVKYAGEFYPIKNGMYELVFSTQDTEQLLRYVLVSQEPVGEASKPTNILMVASLR